MLFIVVYHFCLHAIDNNSPQSPHLIKGFETILHIGVICFVLISGYFGIRPTLKGLVKFCLQCIAYSIGIYAIYCLFNADSFSFKTLIKSLLGVTHGWWFVTTYVCLYIISPIINIPLQTQSTQKKILWILLLGILSFYFGLIHLSPSLADGKNVINFVLIYYIGDFLHNNVDYKKLKLHRNKIIFAYLLLNIGILTSYFLTANYLLLQKIIWRLFFPYNSPGLLINAILLFVIFSSFEFKSKFINWMAGSTFAIYLLHENAYLGKYLYQFVTYLHNSLGNALVLAVTLVILAILVCIICILIDKMVKPILRAIETLLFKSTKLQLLNNKLLEILNS
jgi:surface polysaccharide O-acyltransferase-like enzyme